MFTLTFCLFAAFVAFVQASGDFVLLHTPDSVIFKGNKEIDQSLLKELFSASLGYTVKQKSTWNGMAITSPFSLPEAVVAVAVEGVDSLGAIKGKKFPLNVDEVEETTWQALSGRLEERDSDNTLVRIYLGDGLDALGQSALGELKPSSIDESSLKALSLKSDEDRKFLDEVQLLRAIAKKVPTAISADNKPDVYWLVVSGLKPVFDVHGKNSLAAKEALTLLNEALHDLSKAFMDAYKNQVLIAAFTNDASQVRHTRSILREKRDVATDASNNPEQGKENNSSKTPKRVTEDENEKEEGLENKDKGNDKQKNVNEHNDNSHNTDDTKNTDKSPHSDTLDHKSIKENDDKETDSKENSNTHDDTNTQNTNKSPHFNSHDDKPLEENDDKEKDSKENSNEHNDNSNTPNNSPNLESRDEKPLEPEKLNLAKDYSDDYPVIFNIVLWFGVIFFFSLLAICITIAEMDPGRDSIIYRMTSNRMKKEN